tara:strand:+ start:232 stop:483 length:252 start_codon:yes stop_codon:yes gene_type:complete
LASPSFAHHERCTNLSFTNIEDIALKLRLKDELDLVEKKQDRKPYIPLTLIREGLLPLFCTYLLEVTRMNTNFTSFPVAMEIP